jgi:hypothetical protein
LTIDEGVTWHDVLEALTISEGQSLDRIEPLTIGEGVTCQGRRGDGQSLDRIKPLTISRRAKSTQQSLTIDKISHLTGSNCRLSAKAET